MKTDRTEVSPTRRPMNSLEVTLDYGRTGLTVELPADRVVGPLAIRDVPPLDDPEAAVAAALERPDRHAAAARAGPRPGKTPASSSATSPGPSRTATILGPMLRVLREAGIARDDILILVATGLHRPSTPAEKVEMLGRGDRRRPTASRTITAPGWTSTRSSARPQRGIPAWIDTPLRRRPT